MEAYTNFAEVYDTFMDNVPYEQWAAYIKETLKEDGIADGLVLELGCGTGSMTERLAEAGYDMIGVDNSADMLEIALDKREKSGQDILYLLQDMREFELYGTVRAIISAFLFDFNTRYKYETVLGEQVIAEDREDCSFIWDNYYDQEEQINEYELTLFVKCRQEEDLYRKYQEVHFQRAYTLEEIKTLIEKSGLTFLNAYDDYTRETATEESERIVVVCRECGKVTEKKV